MFLHSFCYCMKPSRENAAEEHSLFCAFSWEMRNAAQKYTAYILKRYKVPPLWKIQLDVYCTGEWFGILKLLKICVVFRIRVKSVFSIPEVQQWDTELDL